MSMRSGFYPLLITFVLLGAAMTAPALHADPPRVTDPVEAAPSQVDPAAMPEPPVGPSGVAIHAPLLPGLPADGKGRLDLAIGGNRRWCTFPDDRLVHPPEQRSPRSAAATIKNPVYTFGYQFTIAAVERARPGTVQMLFESPVVRTATYREAIKVGRGVSKPAAGPEIMEPTETRPLKFQNEQPSTPVPYWQEQYRCATMPESIDFDLDPGVYDVYMAFDILLKSGAWVHRSTAFQTDVAIAAGGITRLQGAVNMAAGGRRELELRSGPAAPESGAGTGVR
jgi:hypothetical protein